MTALLRIGNLVWKEVIQFSRDRLLTTFIFLLPLVQLMLLAQATGERISDLRLAILDLDRSATSRRLAVELDNREELAVWRFVETEEELRRLIDWGRVDGGIIMPRGLEEALSDPRRSAPLQVVVDGSNSVVGTVLESAALVTLTDFGLQRAREMGLATASPIDMRVVTYYNPAYNVRSFAIPAQVGFITYQITLAVASLGLARERELGTLEALVVTPLSRLEMVLGKAIPALVIGLVNFVLLLGTTVYFFHIPMRGSFLLLLGLTILFAVAEIGWGVLISAFSRTQQQAILLVFILAMVDVAFSGYLVPVKNMPRFFQWVSQVVPMYHYLVVLRAVMLRGATLAAIWPHALALAGLAGAILAISVRGVSERLD